MNTQENQEDLKRLEESKVNRIIAYLKLEEKDLEIDTDKIKHHDGNNDKYLEWLGYLYNDEYLKIRLLIAENDKPKNKYSLLAYGKCLFPDEYYDGGFLKLPWGYLNISDGDIWTAARTLCGCNIHIGLVDLDTIEKCKTWLQKNRGKLLKSFLDNYQVVKAEYIDAITNYRLEDFKEGQDEEI